ncbi:MAG TPA: NnrU family protein [Chloroflexia bacterium]|nr:NnrU family protein [Chloroflexia bacterium]
MARIVVAFYGAVVYLFFVLVSLYAIGFVGNYLVPKGIDSGTEGALGPALLVDLLLLALFALQHSLMARPFFKRWWLKVIPPVLERSTYVLFTSLLLALLFWQWQPLRGTIWRVEDSLARITINFIYILGWLIVFSSTFMINHFDLVGLRQVYFNLKGEPYRTLPFTARFLYNFVRHPLMLGFIIAFWATPDMTVGHLLFAVASTGYILIGIQLEERDLLSYHSEEYVQYRRKVSMLLPFFPRARKSTSSVEKTATR